MNGTYNIILKSQLGPKSGTLFLKATRRRLWCCLSILGNENILVGIHDKDTFSLRGKFATALGPVKCQLSGRLLGPNNFDSLANGMGEITVAAKDEKSAKIIETAEATDGSRGRDAGGVSNADAVRDAGGVSDAGGITGENLLEASITIDGKEYQLCGTLV